MKKGKSKKERKMQLLKEFFRKLPSVAVKTLLVIYCLAVMVVGISDYAVPDTVTVTEEEIYKASSSVDGITGDTSVSAKLFGVIPIKNVNVEVLPQDTLIPGGNVFGVKFFTKGVMVVRLAEIETAEGNVSPAKKAGLCEGDVILKINGNDVNTAEEMAKAVEQAAGGEIKVDYIRDNEEKSCVVTPHLCLADKKYKTGIWVRDSTAGIGTMTYYNPRTGAFAGLGHGICDVDTGLLMPLLKGNVVDVEITDIIKGRSGSPGELKGTFDTKRRGIITGNTEHGVYGILDDKSSSDLKPLEIGARREVTAGKATIMCQLDGKGVEEYEIEIIKIKNEDKEGKNFLIKVTDERLLEKTGGIVQGMSGSPIIQNGKIIGAVTHVLVGNPEKGYGIFIENML